MTQNGTVYTVHIFSNMDRTESYEQDSFICLNFSSF
jgi:hypothetical protein